MSSLEVLQIPASAARQPLSPAQKRFNTLIRQIDKAKQTLAAWRENILSFRQKQAEVLAPLQAELLASDRQWVFALDTALDRPGWTTSERDTAGHLICETAGLLLETREDDAELIALFDKHAEVDFETQKREEMLEAKTMAEAMTGLDLGDDEGIRTDADLEERMRQGFEARASAEEAARDAREAKAATRRKTAAQQRRDTEAQQATQSVREVYRKLASALHPDREPDAQRRDEKTALMQQVNQAYAASDLLALLALQLQIEQIAATHIAGASDQRLKHYNKVLGEQLAELKMEIEDVEGAFRMEFWLEPGRGLDPRELGGLIEQTRREWQADLHDQQRELDMLDDTAATKRWLKRKKRQLREEALDFPFF